MKAIILAAGLGTRLLPLTNHIPKALVRVNGITLLEIAIRKLASEGFNEIIINVHHHADQVIEFVNKSSFKNINLQISDESEQLLDTGGAILKARWFLDNGDPFLVHNVDIISDISLKSMLADHYERKSLATLSVIKRQTSRYFLFDKNLKLTGWKDLKTGETRWASVPADESKQLAFSGIHILSPEIFSLIIDSGRFSIIDTYLKLAAGNLIHGYIQDGRTWFDIGKPGQTDLVSEYLKTHPEMIKSI